MIFFLFFGGMSCFGGLGKLMLHLDQENNVGIVGIDDEKVIDSIEEEANEFARNSFISAKEWKAFMNKKYSPYQINLFIEQLANNWGGNPQILFGRYQYETGFIG